MWYADVLLEGTHQESNIFWAKRKIINNVPCHLCQCFYLKIYFGPDAFLSPREQ